MTDVLLVFLKNPVLGKVKTRLAATTGPERALDIYRYLLVRTRAVVRATAATRRLYLSDEAALPKGWAAEDGALYVQQGDDLGARMAQAFYQAFADGSGRVVIIGSDCPDLTPAQVHAAFEALHTSDFVLGPSADGGYYLLGMRAFEPAVFDGIPWSTDTVLADTQARIRQLGRTCTLLVTLSDIDTEQDWLHYQQRNDGHHV